MVSELQNDARVELIIDSLQEGKTREDLAVQFGHRDYRSLDMYMRRRGYTWDSEMQCYIKRETNTDTYITQEIHGGKVAQIIDLFAKGLDAKAVAEQLFFQSHRALAEYMRNKGYQWVAAENNYERVYGVSVEDGEIEDAKLNTASSLSTIEQIPRYMIPGIQQGKNIHISHLLNQMVIEFAREKNIRQREIFETAVIDFFQRYGYAHEVKALFRK
ncbi:hypothetical protein ORD22_08150 [Sporosarcina sp. GW1-11]|uniref:hypothetical protein n=1 Tax=Sporosarcina sp. GW1-11 TaxID=2899126 RepID=UPI00294D3327|nr:hypothetical protein [Sporosarcina sp. GW1-11]MDV6378218.1 hypothetical protein [Sporosarcina sp. GW1-11]